MKELSLNILDIAQNSVKAKASLIYITLNETDSTLIISVSDNGCGMSKDLLQNVLNPFCTTRTTRKVGLGIPLFKLAAEQTGGSLEITSVSEADDSINHGTTTKATFFKNHLDYTPLGDIISTLLILFQGCDEYDIIFSHTLPDGNIINADTREFKEVLQGVPLSNADVLAWLKEFLEEQYKK